MKKWAVSLLMLCGAAEAAPEADGLYATLQTTTGDVCFELYYTYAPRTVANFVSLAEGTRPWIDPRTTLISTKPYYNGLTFHRVMEGFMVQGGSPKGDGTDGPGYVFKDEFHPALRHDRPGIVSMANSGPNSNGGQFFITVTNTPWLDDVHSVFGAVVEGMDVVSNIAAVAVDVSDRPLEDVVITNVFITRNGTNALAFNPNAVSPILPVVRHAESALFQSEDMWVLDWAEKADCSYWVFASARLSSGWIDLLGYGVPVEWGGVNITSVVLNNPHVFFKVTEVLSYE